MTFQEAIKAAFEHPSPVVNVYREDQTSLITVKEKVIYGVVYKVTDLDADDWVIFDFYLATS